MKSSGSESDPDIVAFYRDVLQTLNAAGLPFLVGGGYALHCYTGVERYTKDLDLFIRRRDYGAVSEALIRAGYGCDLVHPHWLAKVQTGPVFIDLIFSSGNGISEVDDAWFRHGGRAEIHGIPVATCPVEEMIWSKAFVMERERYDGADVAHLLRACGAQLDWQRLLQRFEPHWRVLLSHLVLYGFIYPAERNLVPAWVTEHLLRRALEETRLPPPARPVCAGTLLSREQYLDDLAQQGYEDGRLHPLGKMTPREAAEWTDAIPDRRKDEA